MCFILAELNIMQAKAFASSKIERPKITGYKNANGHLILKGLKMTWRWRMGDVLRKYIKYFVRCRTCKSPDTTLNKQDRLYFLKCSTYLHAMRK